MVWCVVYVLIIGGHTGSATTHVAVYPLSQRPVPCDHQCYDVTLAGLECVLCRWRLEPANLTGARERVDSQRPHAAGDAGRGAGDVNHRWGRTVDSRSRRKFGTGRRSLPVSRLGPTPCRLLRLGGSSSLALRRKFPVSSVAIRNVPVSPVVVAGSTAAFTLSLLLFEHLQSNALEIVVAGVDAVGIELNFVHAFIIGGDAVSWSRGRPLRQVSPSPSALLPVCLVSRSLRHRLPQMRDGRRRSCWWHSRNRSDRSRTSRRVELQICSCCFVELFGDVVCHERAGSIWYSYLLP